MRLSAFRETILVAFIVMLSSVDVMSNMLCST